MSWKPTGPQQRVLPFLTFVAALLLAWLAPPPAALAGIAATAQTSDAAVLDTVGAGERTAVKPQPPAQLQSAAKKRLATHGGQVPAPAVAAAQAIELAVHGRPLHDAGHHLVDLPSRRITVAQPRAPPPSSRT